MGGMKLEIIQAVSTLVGLLIGIPWALIVVRMALKKRYKEFQVALIPREAA
jgi:hypothetical protein